MKKIMKTLIIMLVVSLVFFTFQTLVSASSDPVYQLNIKSDNFCNCDTDCKTSEDDVTGCITSITGQDILSLNRYTESYIEVANKNYYNGVCAKLLFDSNEITTTMTKNCTALFEEPEPEVNVPEEPANETETESSATTETLSEVDDNELIPELNTTVQGDVTNSTNTQDLDMEEETMNITTAQLFAITIIVIGFFGLMGWIAYLLKN